MALNIQPDPFAKGKAPWSDDTVFSGASPQNASASTGAPLLYSGQDSIISSEGEGVRSEAAQRVALAEPTAKAMTSTELRLYWLNVLSEYRQVNRELDGLSAERGLKRAAFLQEQANLYQAVVKKRDEIINHLDTTVKEELDAFQQEKEKMEAAAAAYNAAADAYNNGRVTEQTADKRIVDAYGAYMQQLKDNGLVDANGDVIIHVGTEQAQKYIELTNQYKDAVDAFNAYQEQRAAVVQNYNEALVAYNNAVNAYNTALSHSDLINNAQFQDILRQNNLLPPQPLSPISSATIAFEKGKMRAPSGQSGAFISVHIPDYAPSAVTVAIANQIPAAVSKVSISIPWNRERIMQIMNSTAYTKDNVNYSVAYDIYITAYDKQIEGMQVVFPFLQALKAGWDKEKVREGFSDLNKNLLRDALIQMSASVTTAGQAGEVSSFMQAAGLADPRLRTLLSKQVTEALLKESENAQLENRSDELLFLSLGLLAAEGVDALIPALGIASLVPATAAPLSDAEVTALSALSLLDQFLAGVESGKMTRALHQIIDGIPPLAALEPKEKERLVASLQMGQFLVVGKLVEESLGLPGLLFHLLPIDSKERASFVEKVVAEEKVERPVQKERVQEAFVAKGLSPPAAEFLADVAEELSARGPLTPDLPAHISDETVDLPLLTKTTTAALLLQGVPLEKAAPVAEGAIKKTLAEGPHPMLQHFQGALQIHLKDEGVADPAGVAQAARALPLKETHLEWQKGAGTLPLGDIKGIIEKKVMTLFEPRLGGSAAKEMATRWSGALLGPEGTRGTKEQKQEVQATPKLSFVDAVRNQKEKVVSAESPRIKERLDEAFKESIKTMESFPAFAQKLLSPAYSFIRLSGITYDTKGLKKPIDVPI